MWKLNEKMGGVKFAFLYWLTWIILFEISRLAFFVYNYKEAASATSTNIFKSFFYGARMDASMAGYLVLPVCIYSGVAIFFNLFSKPGFYKVYSSIILLPVLLIIFCDLPVYNVWRNRLDATALKYLLSPAEAWASVSNLPVFWIGLFLILSYFIIRNIFFRLIDSIVIAVPHKTRKLPQLLLLLVFIGFQVIVIRGGLQQLPLNHSAVYFSKNNFINLATINANWNFMYTLTKNSASTKNPFAFIDSNKSKAIRDSLFATSSSTELMIDLVKTPKPNVIMIIWESGIEKASKLTRRGHAVMPRLNELKQEGIYFSDIYSSGDRTDKGIVAILSGYPAQPITSIIKIPEKAHKLPTLPALYGANGYKTSFYYGGELEFANMKSYLMGSGFQDLISKADFNDEDLNSKWGAHDHIVKNKLMADLSAMRQPFFTTWLTLTSHEPFETPVPTVISGTDDESLYFNSLHYTDSTIYDFVQQCKQQPWWNNTIIVITADHGHRLPDTGKQVDDFKIPLLFLGGALTKKGIVYDKTGSQTDIAATLISQTGMHQNPFVWSKDLFDKGTKEWAYFSINNAFGFVQDDRYFIFDNVGKNVIEKMGNVSPADIIKGKAIEQESFADYLKK